MPYTTFDEPGDLIAGFRADTITGLSDGDPVATWPDTESGSSRDATQGTGAAQPTYKIVNGIPMVRLDGGDHMLAHAVATAMAAETSCTIFVVSRNTGGGIGDVLGFNDSPSFLNQARLGYRIGQDTPGGTSLPRSFWIEPTVNVYAHYDVTEFTLLTARHDNNTMIGTLRVNGTQRDSLSATLPYSAFDYFIIGADVDSGPAFDENLTGDIQAIFIFGRVFNDTECSDYEDLIRSTYADAALPDSITLSGFAASSSSVTVGVQTDATFTSLLFEASTLSNFLSVAGSVTIPDPATDGYSGTITGLSANTKYYIRVIVTTASNEIEGGPIEITTLKAGGSSSSGQQAMVFTAPLPLELVTGSTYSVAWATSLPAGTVFDLDISDDLGTTFSDEYSGTTPGHTFDSAALADGYYVFRLQAVGQERRVLFLINNSGTFDDDINSDRPSSGSDFDIKFPARIWQTTPGAIQGFIPPSSYAWQFVLGYGGGLGTSSFDSRLYIPSGMLNAAASGIFAAGEFGFGSMEGGQQWSRQYDSEGWRFGVGVFARGTNSGGDSHGISAEIRTSVTWPGLTVDPCEDPNYGSTLASFVLSYYPPPGTVVAPQALNISGGPLARPLFSLNRCYTSTPPTVDVFCEVVKVSGSTVHIRAGCDGEILYDDDFNTSVEFDCGFAGPFIGKIAGNSTGGGFAYVGSFHSQILEDTCDSPPEPPEPPDEPPDVPLEPPAPSRPCVVLVEVFEHDRLTVAWHVTDDPLDPADVRLLMPLMSGGYGEQTLDPINGRASITQLTIEVNDPPTIPGDQDSGIVTGRLADLLQLSAINGRRVRVRRFINAEDGWITICDGPA
jgi:hypothetical protein